MPTCAECMHYKQKTASMGDCFGHEVPGSMDAGKCPAKAFTPRK